MEAIMPGVAPKPAHLRQRRNKSTTKAALSAESNPRQRAPSLPRKKWHIMTKKWWADVWSSPMADEYVRADEHGLFRLAVLIDMYWNEPSTQLASEIRLQEQRYGLSPLDRRRLEWSVGQAEEAKIKSDLRRGKRAMVINGSDPRMILDS
jgi:hypothetical protein